jgi:hypothetical protein
MELVSHIELFSRRSIIIAVRRCVTRKDLEKFREVEALHPEREAAAPVHRPEATMRR